MYRLTERRLQKATGILEKYLDHLLQDFQFNTVQFEHELRGCWNVGYQELKSIVVDMLKNVRYRHVAVYYMEHSNPTGVVSEFQIPLAKVYGIPWYHDPAKQQKQEEFWALFKAANFGDRQADR